MPLKPTKQQQKFFYATKGFCSQVDCTDWPRMTNKFPKIKFPKVKNPKINPLKIPKLSFSGKRGRFDGGSNSDYYTKIFR